MRAVTDEAIADQEKLMMESAKQLRAFFAYQGKDPMPEKRAKYAVAQISSYSRLRASETNRMAIELAVNRLGLPAPTQAPAAKLLKGK